MKNIFKIFAVVIISNMILGNTAFAQTANVQKALENVKENLDELVTAKDENNNNELVFKIETFKKVIDFSITEAKDLKIKILDSDKTDNESILNWREKMIDELNNAIKYYEEQSVLDNEKTISIEKIKIMAQDFKNWRDENYLPIATQIRENILIAQEGKAIQTGKKRLQKINEDVLKIQKAKIKGSAELTKFLTNAEESITQAEKINKEAYKLFLKNYTEPLLKTNSTSTEDLTEATSSKESILKMDSETATSTNATSTTDTKATSEPIPTLSIKDLVGESLNKVKNAYQVFIEMSNLVRKLLK